MRVLINAMSASRGGSKSILEDIHQQLISKQTKDEWIFIVKPSISLKESSNVRIVQQPMKYGWLGRLIFDYFTGRLIVNQIKPDIVFSITNTVIRGCKVPHVLYIHQGIPFQDSIVFSFFKKQEIKLAIYQKIIGKLIVNSINRSKVVIVQSEWMKNAVQKSVSHRDIKLVKISPELISILNNNLNDFNYNVFIYPTSKAIYKNNDCVYNACRVLNRTIKDRFSVEMTLNSGPDLANIEYLGTIPRSDLLRKYETSTLIFASYIESYGLPLAEARSRGTIILAADVNYAREVLVDYPNAYFFDPCYPEQLASLMSNVIHRRIVIKPIYRPILESVMDQIKWDKVIEAITSAIS